MIKWGSSWVLALALSVAGPVASGRPVFDTYFLAVGSTFYIQPHYPKERGFDKLPGANESARLVARILSRNGATGITLTSDRSAFISRSDFDAALATVIARVKAAKPLHPLLVVYFAGHGISEGVAWNHFSVPGNFVYGAPLKRLDAEELARHTVHAANLAAELDRLRIPYLLLLDTCYAGNAAQFASPVLSHAAIESLRNTADVLRYINEFHQTNPVVFSARPGTEVPLAPDPRHPNRASLAPIARRLFLISRAVDTSGGLRLSQFLAMLTSANLDPSTSSPVTYATRPVPDDVFLGRRGVAPGAVEPRTGTATAPNFCCTSQTSAPHGLVVRLMGELSFEGPRGEWISHGRRITLPPNSEVEVRQPDTHSLELLFAGAGGWQLDLSAPSGAPITIGHYPAAERYPFQDMHRPGLSLMGDSRACNEVAGEFTISALKQTLGGRLRALTVEFSQACDGSTSVLHGSVRLVTP